MKRDTYIYKVNEERKENIVSGNIITRESNKD